VSRSGREVDDLRSSRPRRHAQVVTHEEPEASSRTAPGVRLLTHSGVGKGEQLSGGDRTVTPPPGAVCVRGSPRRRRARRGSRPARPVQDELDTNKELRCLFSPYSPRRRRRRGSGGYRGRHEYFVHSRAAGRAPPAAGDLRIGASSTAYGRGANKMMPVTIRRPWSRRVPVRTSARRSGSRRAARSSHFERRPHSDGGDESR